MRRESDPILHSWSSHRHHFLMSFNYQTDNWMRCWFLGIDSSSIKISSHKNPKEWQDLMASFFIDLHRIVRPGGYVAFEVGEVRNGKLLLEELAFSSRRRSRVRTGNNNDQ
ncbi:MAG: hypothetical protein CM1200mP25_3950 [Acidobacteriota bacterium]|nr:MAG: hypothetical protein CM1200mP25_3950 [Acidobacteriota bacterium]